MRYSVFNIEYSDALIEFSLNPRIEFMPPKRYNSLVRKFSEKIIEVRFLMCMKLVGLRLNKCSSWMSPFDWGVVKLSDLRCPTLMFKVICVLTGKRLMLVLFV